MRVLRSTVYCSLVLVALGSLAYGGEESQIVVYNKGQTLRYDPEVGAELKEVILETYDCKLAKLVKKETIEAYFHLSEDKEIISPDAICPQCQRVFVIEKRGEKYFFGGIREKPASFEETAAAAPLPTREEAARGLEQKVKRIAHEIVKIDPTKRGSAKERSRIITAEFTTALSRFEAKELNEVASFVTADGTLSPNNKYYVLRSFGWTFHEKQDFDKAVFFYDKCIEIAPENYSAHFQKAVAHDKAGAPDKALQAFAKALALKPQANIADYFAKFLSRTNQTAKLSESQISGLRNDLAAVQEAIQSKDGAAAASRAAALGRKVEELYAGKAAPVAPESPPPESPPPAPPEGDPIAPQ